MASASKIAGETGLVSQGLNESDRLEKMAKDHKMTLYYRFLDPANAKRFDRPVVDVSTPRNLLDQRDHTRMEAGMTFKGAYFSFNVGHFSGIQEPSPYVYTHHNADFVIQSVIFANALFFNWYISRTQIGGSILGHPHTQWAHNIVFGAGMIRAFLASIIAVGGSLYTYEYLYTHAPYFKIRDPSTNGWVRAWEEGQSTYLARLVSNMWIPVGAAFFTGSFKRFHFNSGVALTAGFIYETVRTYGSGVNRENLKDKFQRENDRQGATGSLDLTLRKQPDYATGLMPNELNTKYVNSNQSTLREFGWVENCFDNLPLGSFWRKEVNHRYNWTFERTSTGERKYKYRNETWELPLSMLDARSSTDVFDKVKVQSPLAGIAAAV